MLRPAGRDGDRGHRQRARVRREERLRRRLPVERAEDRPLEVEVLDRSLDGDVGSRGDRVERHRRPQVRKAPVDPLVDRIRVELELRGPPAKADADALHPCLERRFVDVVEDDLVARFERDLGDPGAHRPGAHDADDGAGQVVRSVGLVHGLTVRQRPVRSWRRPPRGCRRHRQFSGARAWIGQSRRSDRRIEQGSASTRLLGRCGRHIGPIRGAGPGICRPGRHQRRAGAVR